VCSFNAIFVQSLRISIFSVIAFVHLLILCNVFFLQSMNNLNLYLS